MGMLSNVVEELGTSTSLAMYWPNSNLIFVTKINLHTIVSRIWKDLWSQMQTTLNMALAFKSPKRKDSQPRPFQIVGTSFVL